MKTTELPLWGKRIAWPFIMIIVTISILIIPLIKALSALKDAFVEELMDCLQFAKSFFGSFQDIYWKRKNNPVDRSE